MRTEENNIPLVVVGLLLTVGILIAFQVYVSGEPGRIDRVLMLDQKQAYDAGQTLFTTNCVVCHGANGEGNIGPALNSPALLTGASDDTLFSVISSGVPNTAMPAWNQSHGGPFTDEQVRELVTFIRAWQFATPAATQPATEVAQAAPTGNPTHGSTVFQQRCAACHGDNGEGLVGPALNDKTKLAQFDNAWYVQTITDGRPSKGMPTWGTVLAPQDVSDVVAFIRQWATAPEAGTPVPSGTPAEVAKPSIAGGPGEAITLTGDAISGAQVFTANCAVCHGQQGVGGEPNPGSDDGTIPPLNPIDSTLISANPKLYVSNLDLFIEHGSTPAGSGPAKTMPAWGDQKKLTPQQIADVIAYIITLNPPPATPEPTEAVTAEATAEVARPSNTGGPGDAINLTGDKTAGAQVFTTNCAVCHGQQGVGGIDNPGSDDGTVPPLNPIDSTLIDADAKTYATNVDLFIEHGSTPSGTKPAKVMPAWGDLGKLTPQQIADVIAYIESLNPPPAPTAEVARPSNAGGPGAAINLTGDVTSGAQVFTTNCAVCHGQKGVGGIDNPGSDDGTVPPLNPIDSTLIDPNPATYATNVDLFIEHGSTPSGSSPAKLMPAWGDQKKLTPQQIADVIAYIESLNPAAAPTPTATEAPAEVARPSNAGGPGDAVNLTGDAASGTQLFTTNCAVCHGQQGIGGVDNPGSDDGTVPPLNPIDPTLVDADAKTYATNVDLFIEHGSTPSGSSPAKLMPAWGDQKKLTPQQIADIIAYIVSLNPPPARPSNAGGPGDAVSLTGDITSGAQVFSSNCAICHGDKGVGGISNPGSDDGTVPPLNPIDSTIVNKDPATYALNVDLFIEHGSTPEGSGPAKLMPAWGDQKKLTPQQIADVIAFIMSLNPSQ